MDSHGATQSPSGSDVDRIVAEYLGAVDAGRSPEPRDYLSRYPQFAPELQRFFNDIDHVSEMAITRPDLQPRIDTQQRELGAYRLIEIIGQGGMGVVWRAHDTRLGRTVAVKVMRPDKGESPEELERFRREALNAGKLRHPQIVPVHDFGEQHGHMYLVMDYVDGVPLDDALRHGNLSFRDKVALLEKIARAVAYAHSQGVIHRDLKPSNVIVEYKRVSGAATDVFEASARVLGDALVTDFGLAKDLSSNAQLSLSGQVLGTPAYMPPEQAEGSKVVGPRSDVYGLGAILYEMLTGRPPFTGENSFQILRAVASEDPTPPRRIDRKIPFDLETICLKCLRKEPAQRYASAEELADDLLRFLNAEPIKARAASLLERTRKNIRRHEMYVGVFLLFLVVTVVSAEWYFTYARDIHKASQQIEKFRRQAAEFAKQLSEYEANHSQRGEQK